MMRLDFEMLPVSTRGVNLRRLLSRSEWNRIRLMVLREYSNRCAICGRSGARLECHEVWSFDDVRHIQRLERIIPLCTMCHRVKHIGMAGRLARAGRLEYWRVVRHYCEVNGCSVNEFYRARDAAYRLIEQRNRVAWTVDLARFAAHSPQANKARGEKNAAHYRANAAFTPRDTIDYPRDIAPHLHRFSAREIARATGLSTSYASFIRSGKRVPHARHWAALMGLVRAVQSSD